MATTCPGCGKATSETKATCYFCGTFLKPLVKCGKCARMVPQTRTTCQYCGTAVSEGAAVATAAPVSLAGSYREKAPPPSAPAALAIPKFELTDQSAGAAGWLRQYEVAIDLGLFFVALPIAVLAMLTQLVIHFLAKMLRMRGR